MSTGKSDAVVVGYFQCGSFFFNDTATTEIYTLSLHDALPIFTGGVSELVTPAGNLTDTGTIGFSDVDLTDSHSISPTIVDPTCALDGLTASVWTLTIGSDLGGVITWNYPVAASSFQDLANEQS